ncbi:hypothetical protein BGL61_04450 [Helicobacter pylori]|nr:hypothetical protein BGL61_04450 [Helicobacter pylori]
MSDGLICSLCSGFIKKTQDTNSYLVKAAQDTLKTINRTTATQSETESIFLYLLTQMLLNFNIQILKTCLTKPAHKNF